MAGRQIQSPTRIFGRAGICIGTAGAGDYPAPFFRLGFAAMAFRVVFINLPIFFLGDFFVGPIAVGLVF